MRYSFKKMVITMSTKN